MRSMIIRKRSNLVAPFKEKLDLLRVGMMLLENLLILSIANQTNDFKRYSYLRINDESTATWDLVKIIADEVIHIWNCSRIPIYHEKNCCSHINAVIKWRNDSSKFPHEHRMKPEFQRTLHDLLDITEKPKGRYTLEKVLEYLRCVMKKRGKQKPVGFTFHASNDSDSDWENDLEFYIDQRGRRRKMLGPVDSKLTKKEGKLMETGHKEGSATQFESKMMHALLWLACRHHVWELLVKHADIAVRSLNTSAPDDLMFKRFQSSFENLPPCNYHLF